MTTRIKKMTDEEKHLAEERLPKWVQRELATLRMNLREARDEVERVTNGYTGKAAVYVRPFANMPLPIAGVRETIRFILDDGSSYPPHIDVSVEHGERSLGVYGSTGLVIQPSASNHLSLSVAPR
jgi:hypothetical protein